MQQAASTNVTQSSNACVALGDCNIQNVSNVHVTYKPHS